MPLISSANEIVVEMLAAPINPSDIGLLTGTADPHSARRSGSTTVLRGKPDDAQRDALRVGRALPVGNEGAGRVVAAGGSPEAQAMMGRLVALMGGGMYVRYRKVPVADSLVLPEGISAADGASAFINPLTALCMMETMRTEGFSGLVHTAAASNLGRMLHRLCQEEGIPLVNVVRRAEQASMLRDAGAACVLDSSSVDFRADLVDALRRTGARLGFDAIGGGGLASLILSAMEEASATDMTVFNRYGTATPKKMYLYGGLNPGPTEIRRDFGMAWAIGGWLLFAEMQRLGPLRVAQLKARVAAGLGTTFASDYTGSLSLREMLEPSAIAAFSQRATGRKFVIDLSS